MARTRLNEANHAQSSAGKHLWWEAISEATAVADRVHPLGQRGAEGPGWSYEDEDDEGGKNGDRWSYGDMVTEG